jgi:hypothetical protein
MHRQPTKNLSNVISPYYYITVIWDALAMYQLPHQVDAVWMSSVASINYIWHICIQ